jgi:hypothetical protein
VVDCWAVEPPHVTGLETTVAGFSTFVLAASIAILCKSDVVETELVTGATTAAVEVVVFNVGEVMAAVVVDEEVVVGAVEVGLDEEVVVGAVEVGLDARFDGAVDESGVSRLLSDGSSAGLFELLVTPFDVDDRVLLTEDVAALETEVEVVVVDET